MIFTSAYWVFIQNTGNTYLKILLHHVFYRSFTIHIIFLFPVLNTEIQVLNQNTLMVEFVLDIVQSKIHRYFAKRVCTFHNTVVICNFHRPYVMWPMCCFINHFTNGCIKAIICSTNFKKKQSNNRNGSSHDAYWRLCVNFNFQD